jgi:zinc protease
MHHLPTAALIALLAAAPAGAERLEVPYEMFRLPNGLTVIVHEDHSAPLVSVNTWYHVGSSRERPGRTGFAHLFEHLMFGGSEHVPDGSFDRWLETVGGDNNASTSQDRTNYWENAPANALELPLFLESDRMGYLLATMSKPRVDVQRDVVKNERREAIENRPYGRAGVLLFEALFPSDHPYHWPVIGSMEDLSAASLEDVSDFFRRWYGPGNASLVIAGDVDPKQVRTLVEKWFGDIPATAPVPQPSAPPAMLAAEKRLVLEDRVQLPRLYLAWLTPPALSPPDAALDALAGILASGKNARLYKRLVYELQVAQDVSAYQDGGGLASTFNVVVTARTGHGLEEIRTLVDAELARLREESPSPREVARFVNQTEADVYDRLETIGGFGGKADRLNGYLFHAGDPDYFEEHLARYRALSPSDVRAVAQRFLGQGRVVLSVIPEGRRELAVPEAAR